MTFLTHPLSRLAEAIRCDQQLLSSQALSSCFDGSSGTQQKIVRQMGSEHLKESIGRQRVLLQPWRWRYSRSKVRQEIVARASSRLSSLSSCFCDSVAVCVVQKRPAFKM